jgi:hypothetical protein
MRINEPVMNGALTPDELRRAAQALAEFHAEGEDNLLKILWFPDAREIRLIDVDRTAPPHPGGIHPFYFGPDPAFGVPFPSAIAVVAPEDLLEQEPPARWGVEWSDGVPLWEREGSKG